MCNCKKIIMFFLSIVFLNFFSYSTNALGDDHIFDQNGINKVTGTKFNIYGFDKDGFDKSGYNCNGFDRNGFNRDGYTFNGFERDTHINKYTGTKYSPKNLDIYGRTPDGIEVISQVCYIYGGFNDMGFNKDGVNRDTKTQWDLNGFDRHGFDRNRLHRLTGTKRSPQGYDYRGFYEDKTKLNAFTESRYALDGKDFFNKRKPCGASSVCILI